MNIPGKEAYFMSLEGWMVLRFWNSEIHDNMDGVLETILDAAENSTRFLTTKPDGGAG